MSVTNLGSMHKTGTICTSQFKLRRTPHLNKGSHIEPKFNQPSFLELPPTFTTLLPSVLTPLIGRWQLPNYRLCWRITSLTTATIKYEIINGQPKRLKMVCDHWAIWHKLTPCSTQIVILETTPLPSVIFCCWVRVLLWFSSVRVSLVCGQQLCRIPTNKILSSFIRSLSFIMNANTPSPVTPSFVESSTGGGWPRWCDMFDPTGHLSFRAGPQVSWHPLYRYIIVIHTLLCNSPSKYNYIFLFYRYEINKEVTKEQN